MPNISGNRFCSCNTTWGTPYISLIWGTVIAEQYTFFYTSHLKLGNTFFLVFAANMLFLIYKNRHNNGALYSSGTSQPFQGAQHLCWRAETVPASPQINQGVEDKTLVGEPRVQLRLFSCWGAQHCETLIFYNYRGASYHNFRSLVMWGKHDKTVENILKW